MILTFMLSNMTGQELALKILKKHTSTDVFSLAKQAGITVFYEKWHPVTFGEFDKKNLTIHLNVNAPLSMTHILAHELGHFFIHKMGIQLNRMAEESMVEEFASTLLTHYASKTFSMTNA